jgi:YjbE family integral membrane protein
MDRANEVPVVMQALAGLASIVVVDLVLSSDNALVIGMAARRLPSGQRCWAIVLGGAGAIALRIVFTTLAAVLLAVPLLKAAGGVLLLWIAYKLIRAEAGTHEVAAAESFLGAVQTITLADLVMSFDNMLAVGGVASGRLELLTFGLLLSMPLLLFGSGLVTRLLDRLPVLVWAGVVVLTVTGAQMLVDDPFVARRLAAAPHLPFSIGLAAGLTGLVTAPAAWRWWRKRSQWRPPERRR